MTLRSNNENDRTAVKPWDIGFGAVLVVFALVSLFVWFPIDIPTGFFFVNAIGREEPGDAFFPIILAVLLAVLSAVQLIVSLLFRGGGRAESDSGRISSDNLKFLAVFLLIVGTGLTFMYWLGPAVVGLLNAIGILDGSYRNYSDTVPYKYLGYIVGGAMMTLGIIRWTEGRFRGIAVLAVLGILIISVLIFDVALKNVLLPPNADF